MKKEGKKIDKLLIAVSLIVVFAIVGCLYFAPEQTQLAANTIFGLFTSMFGSVTLIFTFAGVLLLVGLAFSKYGNIKLGSGNPEYSTFKWVSMMICCGLGSATVYWAFMEWAYYINTPGLSITAGSQQAYEMSVTYTMFHWGFSAWTLYALVGIPIAYHFYVRKNNGLSFSGILCSITGLKPGGIFSRIVDVLFIFICFGGLSITLGVSVPLVSEIFCGVFGLKPSFMINLLIIIVLSVIYSFSSYIGIQKGMAKISDWNIKLTILFVLGILICGPTLFIIANTTQSFGLMMQNFVHMSLFTDAIGKSGFPETWTIFYWLYWIAYAPFTGVFIAKVSKGRTVRSVIANTLISGSAGCFVFFGIIGSFTMKCQLDGRVDVVGMLANGQGNAAVVEVMKTLPLSSIFMIVFCIITLLFLATTLDGAALTMATTSTKGLKNNEEPSPLLRLFWCIMLALVPLTMILVNADLNTIKTCAIITAIPILFLMIVIIQGFLKWIKKDYGLVPAEKIAETVPKTPNNADN